ITVSRKSTLDWDAMREKVKKGMRNATLMAIAPTASIGLVAGTTPGLDPQFSQIFSRNTSSGKFLEVNRNLVADLQERGLWEDVREELLRAQGDLSLVENAPSDLVEIYKTSFQVDPAAFLHIAARAQKWIDQAISRNIYLENRDIGSMVELYDLAWRMGVKTTYYLHMKPRHQAEQSTVKVNKAEALSPSGTGGRGFGAAVSKPAAPVERGFGAVATQARTEIAAPTTEVVPADVDAFEVVGEVDVIDGAACP